MDDLDPALVAPGYRPEYTGDRSLGYVGSGRLLGANLFALYRAGRNELPEVAQVYAELTRKILSIRDPLAKEFERPGLGPAAAHLRLLDLREAAHEVLRTTCLRMLEVGQALVKIADAYAATDQEAAEEFNRMLEVNRDNFVDPPVRVPPRRFPMNRRTFRRTDR